LPKLADVADVVPIIVDAPADLGSAGRDLWRHITSAAVWLAETDKPMLALLCQKLDRREEYRAIANSTDPVLWTDKNYAYPNPIVGMLSTLEGEISKLAGQLGLTPSERTRMGLAEVKAKNAFEEMLSRRKGPE
jgi:P27 family predicted phage terminase small subunit